MIIAILNQKGGAGKTTLATNIAVEFVRRGTAAVLIDSDPQGSARDWTAAAGETGANVTVAGLDRAASLAKDAKAIAATCDIAILDGAPSVNELAAAAVKAADLVLIPVQPSPYDIWACADLVDLVKARQEVTDGQPITAFVVSRAIAGTTLTREVREALAGYDLPVLQSQTTQRQAFAKAAAVGKGVVETEPGGQAAAEIVAIVDEIEMLLN